jgi:hypothetical protein
MAVVSDSPSKGGGDCREDGSTRAAGLVNPVTIGRAGDPIFRNLFFPPLPSSAHSTTGGPTGAGGFMHISPVVYAYAACSWGRFPQVALQKRAEK